MKTLTFLLIHAAAIVVGACAIYTVFSDQAIHVAALIIILFTLAHKSKLTTSR